MLRKTDEVKVMRDPIHGYIHVEYQILWDCINAREFQRLRRIHQLGGDFQVYHTAEHTRFSHSLGVYEIVRRMVEEVDGLKNDLNEHEKVTVMLAGLLHDIGHGPFSHAFEAISGFSHEVYTKRILLEDSEIHRILCRADEQLPYAVASIISYEHPNELLNQIVSGQLDADRMDYLLRDAYATGTSYGEFDLERILRTIRIRDHQILVKESGIHSVQDYLMARYHMYWQVYLHPVARSFEGMLVQLFKRLRDLYPSDTIAMAPMFFPFLKEGEASIEEHFALDEAAAFYGFAQLMHSEDRLVYDLARRLLNRDLFENVNIEDPQKIQQIRENIEKAGYDSRYYMFTDTVKQKAFSPYTIGDKKHNIWVLCEDRQIREITQVSDIVKAIAEVKGKVQTKVYYPAEITQAEVCG